MTLNLPNHSLKNYKSLPPWPKKKRLWVTIVATGTVLGLSLVIGGVVYMTGRLMGIWKSQPIEIGWLNQVLQDPEVLGTLVTNTGYSCVLNKQWQLIWQNERWQPGDNQDCRELWLKQDDGTNLKLHVNGYKQAKSEIVMKLVKQVQAVVTADQLQAFLPTTVIQGQKDKLVYQAWVMALNEDESIGFEYQGGNAVTRELVAQFISGLAVQPVIRVK